MLTHFQHRRQNLRRGLPEWCGEISDAKVIFLDGLYSPSFCVAVCVNNCCAQELGDGDYETYDEAVQALFSQIEDGYLEFRMEGEAPYLRGECTKNLKLANVPIVWCNQDDK